MERAARSRLISVGSILADIRIEVPHLPPRGGDVLGSAATVSAGGGFNILAAAARQGLPTLFAGQHGTGPYGDQIRAELAREGIDVLLPRSAQADSGFCLVLVEPDGERSFVTSPGVEAALGSRALADIPLAAGDYVFVSGYDLCYPDLGPAIAVWVADMPAKVWLAVDPGPLAGEIPHFILDVVMPRTALWTMNRREAQLLAGTGDTEAIARFLLPRLAYGALLVLRDGREGATLCCAAFPAPIPVPTPVVTMLDSTGAGDAHTGVLIAGLARAMEPVAAITRANAAAALSVTQRGPAKAPTRDVLDRFLAASGSGA
jgi:ribokinase